MTKSMSLMQNLMKPFRSSSGRDGEDLQKIASQEQKQFSFETLVAATKNFHPTHKLGQGGFGPVYKGKLNDGREIAVKKLSNTSKQGKKEFENEAKLLARVQHRNVVNLFGYCVHGTDKLLVYEYVAHESLDKFLFDSSRRQQLDWKLRFDIITGVARGLLYLHEDAHRIIIHRDIKASNILLDEKWVPKISDFGMARLFPEDETHVHTRVAGTNGYMAPEYVMHGRLSDKADVFSFGVLVMELITGVKNSSFDQFADGRNLLDWAYRLHKKDRSLEIVDPVLATSDAADTIKTCIHVGLLCTQGDPSLRPNMSRVVVLLSKKPGSLEELAIPEVPGSQYRRSHRPPWTSSTGGGASIDSSESRSSGYSSSNSQSANTTSASSTSRTGPRSDPYGKRPMQG